MVGALWSQEFIHPFLQKPVYRSMPLEAWSIGVKPMGNVMFAALSLSPGVLFGISWCEECRPGQASVSSRFLSNRFYWMHVFCLLAPFRYKCFYALLDRAVWRWGRDGLLGIREEARLWVAFTLRLKGFEGILWRISMDLFLCCFFFFLNDMKWNDFTTTVSQLTHKIFFLERLKSNQLQQKNGSSKKHVASDCFCLFRWQAKRCSTSCSQLCPWASRKGGFAFGKRGCDSGVMFKLWNIF